MTRSSIVSSVESKRNELLTRLLQQDGFEAVCATIPNRASHEPAPLSFAQQRLWFLDQLAPGAAFYNSPAVVLLDFPVNAAVLERSINEIV